MPARLHCRCSPTLETKRYSEHMIRCLKRSKHMKTTGIRIVSTENKVGCPLRKSTGLIYRVVLAPNMQRFSQEPY